MSPARRSVPSRGLRPAAVLALALACGCSSPPGGSEAERFELGAGKQPEMSTRLSLAHIRAQQGREREAEAMLQQIVAESPECAPAWVELASVGLKQGLVDGAIAVLRQAAEIHPDDPVVLNDLGLCLLLRGEASQAVDLFGRAAAMALEDARPRANLALALGLSGRFEESEALYRQLLPAADVEHNLALLRAARSRRDGAVAAAD